MLQDPFVAPGVVVAPLVGVQVEGAIVKSLDGEVLDEVNTFVPGVCVGTISQRRRQPALITKRDHMIGVEGLDVGAYTRGPVCDHGGGAAGAAGLIAELPREDSAGAFVAVDDEFDPDFVGRLTGRVSVEGVVRSPVSGGVGVDAS